MDKDEEIADLRAKLAVAVKALEKTAATSTPFTIPWTHSVAADTYSNMIYQMKCTARAALAQIKGDE